MADFVLGYLQVIDQSFKSLFVYCIKNDVTFADISIMIGELLLDVFFLDQASDIDLLRFLKLVLFLLFDILLHNCVDFSTGHIVLDLFCQFVEDALVFDHDSEQSLLELIEGKADFVVLVDLLIFGEVPEDFSEFLSVGNERVDLEDEVEVVPSIEDHF